MKEVNRKLIINADDLGMSTGINSKIEKCIQSGIITSSTLMANAPCFEEGVSIAKRYPNISVGVHLNIIEFAPLTNKQVFKKHGIIGDDGCFIEGAIFHSHIDDELKTAIFEEWDAQITKIEKEGVCPSHCDSHEHTHTIKELQDVLCSVLDKHRIMKVRRVTVPSLRLILRQRKHNKKCDTGIEVKTIPIKRKNVLYRRVHFFIVKYISWQWNRTMAKKYSMTDAFCSFYDYLFNRDILHLKDNSSIVEIMCHPGNPHFLEETDFLVNDKSWLTDNVELISYHNL